MTSKSEKTRQFIIEKTASVFNKKGYAGTSLSEITEVTGLTKGSIYGNFKNKDEVAAEAFKYNLKNLTLRFKPAIDMEETAINKLFAFVKVYRSIYKSVFDNGGCPILNTATEADDTFPMLKELANKGMMSLKNTIEKIILFGIQNNEIKKEINAGEIAGFIISIIEGSIVLSKLSDNNQYFIFSLDQIDSIIESLRL